jgi:DNA-binding response OmpR family regulator
MKELDSCFDFSKISVDTDTEFELKKQTYHILMPFRVRDILIVSSLYDAFIIEEEGLISELVIGQYQHHLLSSPPRVTRVTSGKEALSRVKECHYDLIVTMSKNIGMDPFNFGKKIKKENPEIPIILLATDLADIDIVKNRENEEGIDRVFYWTGDSTLFLAIIKNIEDRVNAKYDTKNGNVRVIILVEDTIHHYSMLLPIIYTELVQQTRRSLSEDLNEMQRLLRRRARPKILLAETYEEAVKLYNQYNEYVLGVITDIQFKQKGKLDAAAGFKLAEQVRKNSKYIPILMQSSKTENKKKAERSGSYFLDKNSPTLIQDFHHFVIDHLGFGDFVFLKPKKKGQKNIKIENIHSETVEIARASNMKEFEQKLQKVPLESIHFHADRNDFSNWLMGRCEFKLAMKLRPKKASDFTNLSEVRKHLIGVFNESRRERQSGVITDFSQQKFEFDSSFTRLRGDSLGGKGRGIALMRTLLARYDFNKKYPGININVPSTVVIGTLEFDNFIEENNLKEIVKKEKISDEEIAKAFLNGKIRDELKKDLAVVLKNFKTPIAVRSSSLLEDSQSRPFAGIYSTYMLPNNNKDDAVRLDQLCQAIKLIYASVFFIEPKIYIESTSSKIDEEKMAVIIQELVGKNYGGRFYPTFSGVAQSYNFYPVGHQTFEDGIATIAIGLGKIVVGGGKALRFCPKYPENIPEFSSPQSIFNNVQRDLFVLETTKDNFKLTGKEDTNLVNLIVEDIKNDGTLDTLVSTFDRNDGMIRDEFSQDGPNLVTFAGILKYETFPLPSILNDILEIGHKAMGCPVEIEFAVNLNQNSVLPPTFAILQIRPLVPSHEQSQISWDDNIERNSIFIHTDRALGNGLIKSIKNIIYVPPETFDTTKTIEIANEIEELNKDLVKLKQPYILIGPGRWGSEDRFLGIPVKWNQISGVRVMVETSLENFIIEPSQGTHFFHNITSRGIGYLNVPFNSKINFIDWKWLDEKKPKKSLKYTKYIELPNYLLIRLDGRSGSALVEKSS